MPITKKRAKVPWRKRGERADLNLEKIIAAGLTVLDRASLQDFSAREVAKALGVSSAAIYVHVEGGSRGLKTEIACHILSEIDRPYRPKDTPPSYLVDIALRFLRAVRGRQASAQLVACELASDYLLCPQLSDQLLPVMVRGPRRDLGPTQKLDLAIATLIGMALVEAGDGHGEKNKIAAQSFILRLKRLPMDEVPAILEHSHELAMRIKQHLISIDSLLAAAAERHMRPLIKALQLDEREGDPCI